eukprot:TRINITY_DN5737_c0_g1_i1.p1 TRINITY_DN5737_c0_g1~~TRINITY_DN5737_c0_g1_i1.p1  ORF type:complete len:205 (+),score=79.62 TRINITY_DN5737_c0_g1_i1:112-726(+)
MSGQYEVDALPYVDPPLTEETRQEVERMIEEEMHTFVPDDYLAGRFPPVPPTVSALIAAEYERVARGRPLQSIDRTRFELLPPAGPNRDDPARWALSARNAEVQLEHQRVRSENLELLNAYGKEAWLQHNRGVERCAAQMQQRRQGLKRQIDELNAARKREQTAAGAELRRLEQEWQGLCGKNFQIELETQRVECATAKLRRIL